jgi:hypothetical protein
MDARWMRDEFMDARWMRDECMDARRIHRMATNASERDKYIGAPASDMLLHTVHCELSSHQPCPIRVDFAAIISQTRRRHEKLL